MLTKIIILAVLGLSLCGCETRTRQMIEADKEIRKAEAESTARLKAAAAEAYKKRELQKIKEYEAVSMEKIKRLDYTP